MSLVEPARHVPAPAPNEERIARNGASGDVTFAVAAASAAARIGKLPLDRPDLVQDIAALIVEVLGSGCLIRPCSADGRWIETGWVAHPNQAVAAAALDLAGRWPQSIDQGIFGRVISAGEPFHARTMRELLAEGDAAVSTVFRSEHPELRDGYALLARSSLIVVPIFADVLSSSGETAGSQGRRILGTFALTRDEPLTPFAPDDVAVVQDLAERISSSLRHGFLIQRLRETEARCRELVGQGPGIAYVCGAQSGVPSYQQVSLISPQVWPLLGYTQAEWLADSSLWAQSLHPEDRPRVLAEVEAADGTGEPFRSDYRMITRDRRVIWIRDETTLIRDEAGAPLSRCGVMTDITASHHSHAGSAVPTDAEARRISEQRLLALVRHATDAICILAKDGTITWASPSVERVLGWRPEEIIGQAQLTSHPDDIALAGESLGRVLLEPERPVSVELRFKGRDQEWRWVEAIHTNLLADPTVAGIVVNFHDITDRKASESRLRWQAFHDPLTRLPNRTAFSEKLDALLSGHQPEQDAPVAVLLLDLDQFKRVNDGLGHAAGDLLLQQVAGRFIAVLRAGEFLARFGGDEFVAIVEMQHSQPEAAAERLIASLTAPFDLNGTEVRIDASVGIARTSAISTTAGDLLREADVALYQAKAGGRGRAANYDAAMGVEVLTRLGLESDLRHALERDELRLRFQPVIALASGALVGFEALVRWQHPVRGLVAPAEFLSLAEESGQITSIGEWVLANALAAAAHWPHSRTTQTTPPPSAPGGLAGYPGYAARDLAPRPGSQEHPGQHGQHSQHDYPGQAEPGQGRQWHVPFAGGQPGQPDYPDPRQYGPYGAYPPYPPYPPYPAAAPYGYQAYPPPYPAHPAHAYPGYPPPSGQPGYPGYPGYGGYPVQPPYPPYPPYAHAPGYGPSPAAQGRRIGPGATGQPPEGAPVVMVNLSARQLRQPGLAGLISGLLRAHGIAPDRLVLEVTGHTILEAAGITTETLHALKATGVMLAIDDFGIDASALSLVRRLPFDGLKVDRSFVREIAMDWPTLSIVRTFVSLAHDLGLRVTAEGIETADELGRLREMGCDYGQGYFLAPPLEPDEVPEYIRWVQR